MGKFHMYCYEDSKNTYYVGYIGNITLNNGELRIGIIKCDDTLKCDINICNKHRPEINQTYYGVYHNNGYSDWYYLYGDRQTNYKWSFLWLPSFTFGLMSLLTLCFDRPCDQIDNPEFENLLK